MADLNRVDGARIQGSSDPLWWGLAAVLSLGSLWLPKFLSVQSSETTRLLVVETALFFTGALIGSFRRRRVWRWALAALVAFAVRDLARVVGAPNMWQMSYGQIAAYLAGNSEMYVIQALPVFAGAFFGSWISSAGLD